MLPWASSIGAHNTRDAHITHIITSGGGFLSIPDDKHDEFEEQYAKESVCADRSVTLSEVPSSVFPMFLKINHLNKDGLTKDGMLKICSVVAGVLSRYYPDTTTSTLESVAFPASSVEVEIDGSTWTERGFGLVFRNLFVTKEAALQLRHTVVCELDGQMGSLGCSEYQWSNAIAREVYTTGMEMYGPGRSVSCTKCFPAQPVSGAEKQALKELEEKHVGQRKKIRPIKGFDYGSLPLT